MIKYSVLCCWLVAVNKLALFPINSADNIFFVNLTFMVVASVISLYHMYFANLNTLTLNRASSLCHLCRSSTSCCVD